MDLVKAANIISALGIDDDRLSAGFSADNPESMAALTVSDLSYSEYRTVIMTLMLIDPFCVDEISVEILDSRSEDEQPYQIYYSPE